MMNCEQCGKQIEIEQEIYELAKPEHIFCDVPCRSAWINANMLRDSVPMFKAHPQEAI